MKQAEILLKPHFYTWVASKTNSKNAKSQFEQAKNPPENPKTQFENAKTQFENWKSPIYCKVYTIHEI